MGKPRKPEIVGVDVISQDFGVTTRQVWNYLKKGLPQEARGKFDRVKAMAWWQEFRESGGKNTTLVQAETRLKTAQAQIQELKLAQARGELVPTPLIGKVWERVIGSFRSRMLSIPRKAIPRLRGISGDAAKEKILNGMVCEALDELAGADYSGILGRALEDVTPGDGTGEGAPPVDGESVGGPAPRPVSRGKRRAGEVEHRAG
jgi:phage terminase Nu1 subunit (DNA packaging protein)